MLYGAVTCSILWQARQEPLKPLWFILSLIPSSGCLPGSQFNLPVTGTEKCIPCSLSFTYVWVTNRHITSDSPSASIKHAARQLLVYARCWKPKKCIMLWHPNSTQQWVSLFLLNKASKCTERNSGLSHVFVLTELQQGKQVWRINQNRFSGKTTSRRSDKVHQQRLESSLAAIRRKRNMLDVALVCEAGLKRPDLSLVETIVV